MALVNRGKISFLTAEGTESGTSISSWFLLTLYFFCFQKWNLKINLERRSHGEFFQILGMIMVFGLKMKLTLDFLWIMTAATKIAAMTITRTTERT